MAVFECPICRKTGGREGPFKTAHALAMHKWRSHGRGGRGRGRKVQRQSRASAAEVVLEPKVVELDGSGLTLIALHEIGARRKLRLYIGQPVTLSVGVKDK